MINIPIVPTGFRDFEWLLFSGSIKRTVGVAVFLKPDDFSEMELVFAKDDVLELKDVMQKPHVFVKRNAQLQEPLSFKEKTSSGKGRCSPACASAECGCVGNLEICCDTGIAVGGCYGSWPCP
jgi:hypothetical protein